MAAKKYQFRVKRGCGPIYRPDAHGGPQVKYSYLNRRVLEITEEEAAPFRDKLEPITQPVESKPSNEETAAPLLSVNDAGETVITEDALQAMTTRDLRKIADEHGISLEPNAKKQDMIDSILVVAGE